MPLQLSTRHPSFDNMLILDDINAEETEEDNRADKISALKSSNVWDCRALRWPPRNPYLGFRSMYRYLVVSPYRPIEALLFCFFVWICYTVPEFLLDEHQRPIPYYQLNSDGEVLVDLTFNNAFHHNETIPGTMLNFLCVIFPISVFVSVGWFFGPGNDLHASICMYLLAMGMKIFVTETIKRYVGYLRPNFYDMCNFNNETFQCEDPGTAARKSFPSGHAATSMAAMCLLALFLMGKVRGGFKQRGVSASKCCCSCPYHASHLLASPDDIIWCPTPIVRVFALLAVSPVFLGIFIACSRVRDNWHHPADVVAGMILGACTALFSHGLFYPPVYSYYAGIPLSTVKAILVERRMKVDASDEIDQIDMEPSEHHV